MNGTRTFFNAVDGPKESVYSLNPFPMIKEDGVTATRSQSEVMRKSAAGTSEAHTKVLLHLDKKYTRLEKRFIRERQLSA